MFDDVPITNKALWDFCNAQCGFIGMHSTLMFVEPLCILLLCSPIICTNNPVHHGPMVVFVCLHITQPHYHHYVDVSESIELLDACQVHSVGCVSTSILSIIFHAVFGALCIHFIRFSYGDCENTCILSYHHQIKVWSICHCLRLGRETMVCTICLFIFAGQEIVREL